MGLHGCKDLCLVGVGQAGHGEDYAGQFLGVVAGDG